MPSPTGVTTQRPIALPTTWSSPGEGYCTPFRPGLHWLVRERADLLYSRGPVNRTAGRFEWKPPEAAPPGGERTHKPTDRAQHRGAGTANEAQYRGTQPASTLGIPTQVVFLYVVVEYFLVKDTESYQMLKDTGMKTVNEGPSVDPRCWRCCWPGSASSRSSSVPSCRRAAAGLHRWRRWPPAIASPSSGHRATWERRAECGRGGYRRPPCPHASGRLSHWQLVALRLADNFNVRGVVREASRVRSFLPADVSLFEADLRAADPVSELSDALKDVACLVVCTGTTAFPTKAWSQSGRDGVAAPVLKALFDAARSAGISNIVPQAIESLTYIIHTYRYTCTYTYMHMHMCTIPQAIESLTADGYNTPQTVDLEGTLRLLRAWEAAAGSKRKHLVLLSSTGTCICTRAYVHLHCTCTCTHAACESTSSCSHRQVHAYAHMHMYTCIAHAYAHM